MTIKMVALDLDDTLLNSTHAVSLRAHRAIQLAVEAGVMVTMATGRMYRSALPYALELGLDVPLVTYNGALIKWSRSGETLLHRPIDVSLAEEILNLFRQQGWYIQSYINDVLYVAEKNHYADYYESMTGIAAIPLGQEFYTMGSQPSKLLVVAEPRQLAMIRKAVADAFGKRVNLAVSGPMYLEIVNPMVSKGRALAFLAESRGIIREEVMAVGDSQNDLDMISYAGFGVAMGNAMPEVIAAADAVTAANDADGVAEAIEKYVLENIT
ncbi:MAG: yidA 2 [Firmicutes bacterium]|nr:yidA 2 [Bacillota bacterium]